MTRAPRGLLALAAAPPDQGRIRCVTDRDRLHLRSGERVGIAGIDAPEANADQARHGPGSGSPAAAVGVAR
jgi:endonuclease YncB( thermonuclease family)